MSGTPHFPDLSQDCVAWCCDRSRNYRLARLVPEYYRRRVFRQGYWFLRVENTRNPESIKKYLRVWVGFQSSWPWWVVLLVKIALDILVRILLEWLSVNRRQLGASNE